MRGFGQCPERGDAEREQHGFNKKPHETDIVTAVPCQYLAPYQGADHTTLNSQGAYKSGVLFYLDINHDVL